MFDKERLYSTGIRQFGITDPVNIVFDKEIRKMCECNACRQYGKTWACPPAVGTVDECREKCLQYGSALVFCAVYPLQDSFDYSGMMRGHSDFITVTDKLYDTVKDSLSSFIILSHEGCSRSCVCTYPKNPCRFPEKLFPSIEGYGINVSELAKSAGL